MSTGVSTGLLARHPVGRGDLVRLLEAEGLSNRLAARLTGFVHEAPTSESLHQPSVTGTSTTVVPPEGTIPAPAPPSVSELWRVARQEVFPAALAGTSEPRLPALLADAAVLADEQLQARRLALPRVPPLAPWRRLAPALRALLSRPQASARLDEQRLVSLVARLQPVSRVPRRTRRRWCHRLQVIWDRAEQLEGFVDDQASVLRWLARWHGPVGLEIVKTEGGPPPDLPSPGATVFALSDLGCLEPDELRRDWWCSFGRRLQQHGVAAVALALAPARCLVRAVAQTWTAAPWEEIRPHGHGAAAPAGGDPQDLVEQLLDLLSVAARIDTAVLRAVRRLLPGADLAVESEARNHPDVVYRSHLGIALNPAMLELRRSSYLDTVSAQLSEQVAAVLRRYHQDLPPCLLHEEMQLVGDEAEQQAALTFLTSLARRINERGLHDRRFLTAQYVASWQSRRTRSCWARDEAASLWAVSHRTADCIGFDEAPPAGLSLSRVAWVLHRQDQVSWWRACQRGDLVEVVQVEEPAAPLPPGSGFLLGYLPSRTGIVTVLEGSTAHAQGLALSSGRASIKLQQSGSVVLESDGGVLELAASARPAWASSLVRCASSGETWLEVPGLGTVPWPSWASSLDKDEYGLVAELELAAGVGARFRWIPPGTFLMGSPEDEVGRNSDEGPQHEVQLTRGYWLAETVCTQRQWEVVQGSNPSRFKGPELPVENVSWHDSEGYCHRVSQRFPDLQLRLPTEAEWEYACRAGSTSAFHDGSHCTAPEGADPALARLAWYDKNSGGKPHPVKQKKANAWGLYDMHGNIWEWCADWWQHCNGGAGAVDPVGPSGGRFRVVRGGGCWGNARDCRSAYRDWWQPGSRSRGRGFRFLSGQARVSKGNQKGAEQSGEEPRTGGTEGGTTESRRSRFRDWLFGRDGK